MAEQTTQAQGTEANAIEENYSKLATGEMSLKDIVEQEPTNQEPATTDPVEPTDTPDTKVAEQKTEGEEPKSETLEDYKARSQQEIERLNKIAKDNQAEFTRRSQELSAAKAEIAELKEQLESFTKAQNNVEDEDFKALEDYPDDVKRLFKKLADKNKVLEAKMSNVDKFVKDEEGRRATESAKLEQLRRLQQDFAENILPKIKEEEPDYDAFMRQNMQGYERWAMTLSEGERFSFLNSKDPRDLIRGYREYKKFLNLPYEQEAIKQTKKENENKTGLYSTNATPTRRVAPKAPEPILSQEEAWEQEINRQAQEYNQRR